MLILASMERIRAFTRNRGWKRNRLATEAEVAESTIRDIFDDDWNPRATTLKRLESIIPDDFKGDDVAEAAE